MRVGLRARDVGSERLPWSDLRDFIRWLPADSALARSVDPDRTAWTVSDHLLAVIADSARWVVWSKTKDGMKGRRRPDPIPRPGQKDARRMARGRFAGVQSMPVDDLKKVLEAPRTEIE